MLTFSRKPVNSNQVYVEELDLIVGSYVTDADLFRIAAAKLRLTLNNKED